MLKQKWKKVGYFLLVVISIFSLSMSAFAANYGNEWVYDDANVISKDTQDYIKNLNENVFANYKQKPQLAIIVINDLPNGMDIDSYKMDMFNQYGVGTADENCGMLFVLAIHDRQYGLEIGDGFTNGSLLRQDLETDFITDEMKNDLRSENYDGVVLQVAKHLESLMADEENGIYAQREADRKVEKERQAKAMDSFATVMIIGVPIILIVIAIWNVLLKYDQKKFINNMMEKYQKQMKNAGINDDEFRDYHEKQFSYRPKDQMREEFLRVLYQFYSQKEIEKLKEKNPNRFSLYKEHLREVNTFEAFGNCELRTLDEICDEVDEMEKTKEENLKENKKAIDTFLKNHRNEIENAKIVPDLLNACIADCSYNDRKITENEIAQSFERNLKRLNFEREVDVFLSENQGNINSEYFDKTAFYNEMEHTDEYRNYAYSRNYSRAWMYTFLIAHVAHNKQEKEERKRQEEIRRQKERERRAREERNRMNSYNSSFGSGFGGGHSSGGGFSGGW